MLIDGLAGYDCADFGILSNILLKDSIGRSLEVRADSIADRLVTCTGRRVKHFPASLGLFMASSDGIEIALAAKANGVLALLGRRRFSIVDGRNLGKVKRRIGVEKRLTSRRYELWEPSLTNVTMS